MVVIAGIYLDVSSLLIQQNKTNQTAEYFEYMNENNTLSTVPDNSKNNVIISYVCTIKCTAVHGMQALHVTSLHFTSLQRTEG
jgi:hypothetical protein